MIPTGFLRRNSSSYAKVAPQEGRREHTRTKKICCPAHIVVHRTAAPSKDDPSAVEVTPWVVKKIVTVHNHLMPRDAREAKANTLTQEERQRIYDSKVAGVRATTLQNLLQNESRHKITLDQINNAIQQEKLEYKDGRSDLRVLRDQLSQEGYHEKACLIE
jgi:hypothetical protein